MALDFPYWLKNALVALGFAYIIEHEDPLDSTVVHECWLRIYTPPWC